MPIPYLLLASQSPRRREMVAWLGLPMHFTNVAVDEQPEEGETPQAMTIRLALAKAHEAAHKAAQKTAHEIVVPEDAWIIAADTTVDLNHRALGKPETPEAARAMLQALREQPHHVHTGLAIQRYADGYVNVRCVTTEVHMRRYTESDIETYIASNDPMDKAGAYAIQHPSFNPVKWVNRCYANVVGLPLCAIAALFDEWESPLATNIPNLCLKHFNYQCPRIDSGIRYTVYE